jgi:hypothetical protein
MTQESALAIMKTGQNIFLTGAPGAGKTYVLNQYIDYLKKNGVEAAVTAPTGIAASHIGGVTIQSFFGTGIRDSLSQYDIENLTEKKYLWERMKDLKVLIIDEVSMLSPQLFNSINALLQTFKFNSEPFGGIQVILVGDFFQLPPVSKKPTESRFAFQADIWNELDLNICYLSTSHRHKDEVLLKILNEMRSGSVSEESMNHFRSRYRKNPENASSVTKLYTHNMVVNSINERALDELDTPVKVFDAHTTGPKKWLDRVFGSSLVIPNLRLKEGALVFFIKNNYEKEYINGTLGIVVEFDTFGVPIVETRDGRRIKADREEWTFTDNDGKPKATIKQIPLRLAWAITVHKSQGMTLESAEIDLSQAFEPGQGYVALSRITSLGGLKLMGLNQQALQVDDSVLAVDATMRNSSDELHAHLETLDELALQEQFSLFLQTIGGSLEKGTKKKAEAAKSSEPKKKSFLETKPFFERQLSIEEIATIRGLKEPTIWNHLHLILADDPEFDITYLQPDIDIIEAVENALAEIEKKADPEDRLENGTIRLRAIYEALDEVVDYGGIKCSLLFLE